MSAPKPTLMEQATIERLGMFDLDILAEMEEHADDEVPCYAKSCNAAAAWRVVTKCCGHQWPMCTEHLSEYRRKIEDDLATADSGRRTCPKCPTTYRTRSFDTVFRVVPL